MRTVITGGTGFIGSRLALRCKARGDEVLVLAREGGTDAEVANRAELKNAAIEVQSVSVTDRDAVFAAVSGADLVFHLAAAQHEMNIGDDVFRDVNVNGTRNILDACIETGVQRLVHGSTIGVYGRDLDCVVDEETPLKPDNIYGVTKAEGEAVVRQHFDRLPCVIIRISETYGPGDRRLLKLFRAIKKRMFFMIGRGENLHQLIYVEDLVDGLILASESPAAVGGTFLLAGEERLTSNQMAAAVAEAVGTPLRKLKAPLWLFMWAAIVMEKTMRPLGLQPPLHRRRMDFFTKSFQISTQNSKMVLGFQAKTNFLDGTKATAKWYQGQGYL